MQPQVPWYRGRSLVWDAIWTLLLRATIKTPPDRLVLRPQKLKSQNAKTIMTSKAITTFNQWQLRPLVCTANPLPLFWVVFRRNSNLLMCLVTPGSTSGSTSVCPWLWPREMLPAYWPVCKFDLILTVLFLPAFNVLTTITAYHLPLYQCVATAFRILVLSVRFIVPSVTVVQCYLVHWLNILSIAWPMMRVQRGFMFNIAWNLLRPSYYNERCSIMARVNAKTFYTVRHVYMTTMLAFYSNRVTASRPIATTKQEHPVISWPNP